MDVNYRVVLSSLAFVVFGIGVIVLTAFYSATNGFTEPATFYSSYTSVYTIGFRQGLQVVAVGASSSSTVTSQSLNGLTFYMTQVSVEYVPTANSTLNYLYLLALLLFGLAIVVPVLTLNKEKVERKSEDKTKVY